LTHGFKRSRFGKYAVANGLISGRLWGLKGHLVNGALARPDVSAARKIAGGYAVTSCELDELRASAGKKPSSTMEI
jgi:hypothetical protein